MNASDTAKQILQAVQGEENITFLTHCVTRLRFNLKSMDHISEAEIKAIPGVVGVVNKGGQFQIIIGSDVVKVYQELMKLGDFQTPQNDIKEKKGIVTIILDALAGIFSPIMPIIAGAGMIKALLSILLLFNWIDKAGNTYYFLNFIADASYYFLPIFLAASASKKFKCNMQMAMLMGAILLHPNLIALKETGDIVHVLGIPVKMVTYSSSVIPIIMIVLVLSYVEKFVERITPSMIKFIAKPLLTILFMTPIALVVLGPLGSFLGDALVSLLLSIEKIAPWILPTIIGAFMPFLVMTGMHYSLLPAYVNSLSMLGHESIIGPGNLPSNIAQGAAALCVAVKTKNKEFRQLAVSSGITALLGVTEPALFGVNLRLKKPLIATTIGGCLGGLYAGITGVLRFGGGGAGLAAIGLYVGDNPNNVINALISAVIAFVITFAIQWYLGFEDVEPQGDSINTEISGNITQKHINFASPINGVLIALEDVNDPVFSSNMMGKGFAIIPEQGELYSPIEGEIVTVFDTKHAIGIRTKSGAEVLIHVGIDTVELQGKYFSSYVKIGDQIKAGTKLLSFDNEAIKRKGYDLTTIVVVTNMNQFHDLTIQNKEHVSIGDIVTILQE